MSTALRIALVSCGKKKATEARPARELYTGNLFQAALGYVEPVSSPYDAYYILSAKHGLVRPSEVLEPYDFTMRQHSPAERQRWARRAWASLVMIHPIGPLHIDILAGSEYVRPLLGESIQALTPGRGQLRVDDPMAGLQIGQRLQWLGQRREALSAVAP